MSGFTIVTDSNADMAPGYAEKNKIVEMQLTYTLEEKTYQCNDPALTPHMFYDKMRGGLMPKTAAINLGETAAVLTRLAEEGQDVLCIAFSSALSGTYNNFCLAADEARGKHPERTFIVIDSLCASAGQGMLVARAAAYRDEGIPLEEAASRIRADLAHIAHLFTVDDLFHLHRGGRVSAASAVVGSMLGIKPVLHMDNEGRLTPTAKVRGRKQSLLALVENMGKQMDPEKCDRFALSHGDCLEDAQFVADEVCRRFGLKEYAISYVGATVGAHSGPGTVALFFYAKIR